MANIFRLKTILADFPDPIPSFSERQTLLDQAMQGFKSVLASTENSDAGFMLAQVLRSKAEDGINVMENLEEASSWLDWVYTTQLARFETETRERAEADHGVNESECGVDEAREMTMEVDTDEESDQVTKFETVHIEEAITGILLV